MSSKRTRTTKECVDFMSDEELRSLLGKLTDDLSLVRSTLKDRAGYGEEAQVERTGVVAKPEALLRRSATK